MAKPQKRSIRLIRAPWLSLHRRLRGRRAGSLRLTQRRRQWGFVLLSILLALIGLFFYLTNPRNLRTSAERYLQSLVNGRIEVAKASFSLTQGIRLADIRVLTKEGQGLGHVIFTAGNVNLKVSWLALLEGRLEATEITAFRPEVFLVEDSSGHWNYESLFVDKDFKVSQPLPKVILREGRIHYYELLEGEPLHGGTFNLNARFEPVGQEKRSYLGQVQTTVGHETVATVEGYFDTVSGTFSKIAAQISLSRAVRQSLPRRARAWMDKYNIAGQLSIRGRYDPRAQTRIVADLEGVSFRLPLNQETWIDVSEIQGQLQFTDQAIFLGASEPDEPGRVRPLRLRAQGAKWEISGKVLGYKPQADFELNVSCGQLSLPRDRELIKSLPKIHRDIFEDWNPSGRVALEAKIKKTAGADPQIQVEGYVRSIEVRGSFRHFPYRLEKIRGIIRFDSQKTVLEGFRARHQSRADPSKFTELTGSGQVLPPYEDCHADITVTASNLILDDELREALAQENKAQWDMFDPSGTAEVSCRLVHKPGLGPLWLSYIEGMMTGAKATAQEFAYPLTNLRGRIYIGPEKIEIGRPGRNSGRADGKVPSRGKFVTGLAGKAPVKLRGTIRNLQRDDESTDLEVWAEGLELDEVLARALQEEARKLFEVLNPSGPVNIAGTIRTFKSKPDEPEFFINLWPVNAACRHKEFPYPLEQVKGYIVLTPGRFEIRQFTAQQGPASFEGRGFVSTKDNEHFEADLTITGKDVQLDKTAYRSLRTEQQRIWDELQPKGKCDVVLKIINDPAGVLSYRARINPRGAQIAYKHLPHALGDLTGEMIFEPDLVRMDIHSEDPSVGIKGQIELQKNAPLAKFAVVAKDIALDEDLKEILPENLRDLWDSIRPDGAVDVVLDKFKYAPSGAVSERWDLQGRLTLKDVSLKSPVACEGLGGKINGSLRSGSEGLEVSLKGQVSLPELSVGPLCLQNLGAVLIKNVREKGQWRIDNIQGDLAGGRVAGSIKVGTDGADGFVAVLQAEKVNLKQLLAEIGADRAKDPSAAEAEEATVKGRLKGSVKLEGKFKDPASTAGRGKIYIDRTQLYRLPLMIRVMRSLKLQPVKSNAFNTASVDFYLEGEDIVFSEIVLEGPALRMMGTGKYDKSTDSLSVVVARDPPKSIWRSLPSLPEAMVAEISGSLAEPKVQAKPFRDISEELKKLFHKRKPKGK